MNNKIDYQDLIDEIKEEVKFGILSETATIQILRDINSDSEGYKEILDWYYNKETMDLELAPDEEDSKEDSEDKALIKKQYLQDLKSLKDITVEECLKEMFSKTSTPAKKSKGNKKSNPYF